MSNDFSPYLKIDEAVRAHLEHISTCRDANCPVPQSHPFYPVPEQPPFYYGKHPCLPVVPTRLVMGRVMVLGIYPNCRRATVKVPNDPNGAAEAWVPVQDAQEPFEYARYFDTYSVRDLRAGTILQKAYWSLLGLDRETDMWITNIVKCFLFEEKDVQSLQHLGWTTPTVSATRTRYFEAAAVCMHLHLTREIELCKPKLVLSVGGEGCRVIHGRTNNNDSDAGFLFSRLRGKLLRAGIDGGVDDTRTDLFRDLNVMHLYHPSGLSLANLNKHLRDMESGRRYLVDLGLAPQSLLQRQVTQEELEEIKDLIRETN